jgi:HK97 family phage portal protein
MLIGGAPGEVQAQFPAGQRLTGHQFWASVLTHALWWGRGAFVFMEAADRTPLPGSMRQLNPFLIERHDGYWVINPHSDDPVVTDFDGRFTLGGQPWRLVVMRGLAPNDDHTPEGVLTRHFDTLRLGAAVSKYVADTFAAGGVPSGFLKVSTPNMTQQTADALKKAWMAAHGGGKRSVAVLNATTEYQPVAVKPIDTDAANIAKMSEADIAHAFNLSSIWLDAGASGLTYQNQSDRRRDLVDLTLTGWGQALMETLSSVLPFGTEMKVQWATFTAPNLNEQVPTVVQAVTAGLMTIDEGRALLGLEPNAALTRPRDPKPDQITPDEEEVQDAESV